MNKQQRFQKPFHFLSRTGRSPATGLQEVFQNFSPGDFSRSLDSWQRIALSNERSVYDEAGAREDLAEVTDALKKLVECWHIIFIRKFLNKSKPAGKLEQLERKILIQEGMVYTLGTEEQAKPVRFIHRFCQTFDRIYIEMELLDMLDAVVTYDGEYEEYKGNLVFFYQHLLYLVRLTYKLNNAIRHHSKQKP
ncbi:MAG: hypothetical protein M9904_06380 [Chitinophagaceae bacterium]|nr:hypothetical protein [Chitinophagaceae bacterium]